MAPQGPERRFATALRFGRYRIIADIGRCWR
jgi:hypothetical protein